MYTIFKCYFKIIVVLEEDLNRLSAFPWWKVILDFAILDLRNLIFSQVLSL